MVSRECLVVCNPHKKETLKRSGWTLCTKEQVTQRYKHWCKGVDIKHRYKVDDDICKLSLLANNKNYLTFTRCLQSPPQQAFKMFGELMKPVFVSQYTRYKENKQP